MITIISPAKSLDLERTIPTSASTIPVFENQANALAKKLGKMSAKKLGDLMLLSDNLAQLNADRYKNWNYDSDEGKRQAIFTFNGDVYAGLEAYNLSKKEIEYAQNHLFMLSGLYGILRPLDLIQPYRLEMGTKWAVTPKKSNLYKFWDDQVTNQLNKIIGEQKADYLINLASNEYSKVIQKKSINGKLIDISFKDEKNGQLKVISFFAKKARGMMARHIIKNEVKTIDELKKFNGGDYQFAEEYSSESELVFVR